MWWQVKVLLMWFHWAKHIAGFFLIVVFSTSILTLRLSKCLQIWQVLQSCPWPPSSQSSYRGFHPKCLPPSYSYGPLSSLPSQALASLVSISPSLTLCVCVCVCVCVCARMHACTHTYVHMHLNLCCEDMWLFKHSVSINGQLLGALNTHYYYYY